MHTPGVNTSHEDCYKLLTKFNVGFCRPTREQEYKCKFHNENTQSDKTTQEVIISVPCPGC